MRPGRGGSPGVGRGRPRPGPAPSGAAAAVGSRGRIAQRSLESPAFNPLLPFVSSVGGPERNKGNALTAEAGGKPAAVY